MEEQATAPVEPIEEGIADTPVEPAAEEPTEVTVEYLKEKRMGSFKVKMNYPTLKFVKNKLTSSVEWRGPSEAYLMANAVIQLDSALSGMDPKSNDVVELTLPSAVIESIAHFFSKVTGTGLDSAQRLFSAWMCIRPAVEVMRVLDQQIEKMEKTAE